MKKLSMELTDKTWRLVKCNMLFFLFALSTISVFGQDDCPEPTDGLSSVIFSLDGCTAFFADETNADYSEFTPENSNSSDCADMLLIGRSLYRNNPSANPHSCTPGIDGSEGVCVSASMECDFVNDSDQAIRFDIELTPSNGTAQLKELKFYEKGPEQYVWIDGETGLNNYPKSYGIRITVGGAELYKRVDIPTNKEWTLQTIDLSQVDGFTVDQPTIFSFELLGYCTEDKGGELSIWDVDDIRIYAGCITDVNGGQLTTIDGSANIDLCVGESVSYTFTPTLEFASGENQQWILTDANGLIIGLPTGPSFDFAEFGEGPCSLYNVSYDGDIFSLLVGSNLSEVSGCFDLSNAISINKKLVEGAALDFDIAFDGCGNTNEVEIKLSTSEDDLPSGVDPSNNRWEITQGAQSFMGTGNPFTFTLTDNATVEIALFNEAVNGCELVGQKSFDPTTMTGEDPKFRFDVSDCSERDISATFISEFESLNGVPVSSYDWVFFMNNNSFEMSGRTVDVQIPTRFNLMVRLKLTLENGCSFSVTESVDFGDVPSVKSFSNPIYVCDNTETKIVSNPNSDWFYNWVPETGLTFSSTSKSDPVFNSSRSQMYKVTVISPLCTIEEEIEVIVLEDIIIDVVGDITNCSPRGTLMINDPVNISYEWATDDNFENTLGRGTNIDYNFTGQTEQNVYVRATAPNGCVSKTQKVDIKITDGIDLIFADGGDGIVEVCAGVGGMVIMNPNPQWTYTWSPMTGITGDLSNPKINPSETTTYSVTVTSGDCEVSGDIEVVPGNQLDIEVRGLDADGNLNTCAGSANLFVMGMCEPNYEWSTDASFSTIISTYPSLNVTENGTYYVRGLLQDCVSEVEEIDVTLGDGPSIEFTDDGDGTIQVCEGVGGMIVKNPNPTWTYIWSPTAGLSGDLSSPKVNPTETTVYKVTVTDGSCEAFGEVEVVPGNQLDISIVGTDIDGNVNSCSGAATLTAVGNCDPNYEWSTESSFSNIIATTSRVVIAESGTYFVRATLQDDCESEVEMINITLGDGPFLEFIDGGDGIVEICEGEGAMIVLNPNPEWTYTWSPMLGVTGDLSNPKVNPTESTIYTVTVSDGNCESISQVEVKVGDKQEIEIIGKNSNGEIDVCSSSTTLMVTGSCEPAYEWSRSSDFSEVISNQDFLNVTTEGTYYVRAVVDGSCTSEVEEIKVTLGDGPGVDFTGGDDGIAEVCGEAGGLIVMDPNPNWTYTWSPNEISGDPSNPKFVIDGTTKYTVTVTDGTCEAIGMIIVTPGDRLEIEILDEDENGMITDCGGEKQLVVRGNCDPNYEWSDTSNFGEIIGTSDRITVTTSGTYYVRAVIGDICESEVEEVNVSLGADDLSIEFMGGDDGIINLCDGVGGMIIMNANPEWTYTWSPMDGISGDLSNPLVNPDGTTVYTVTVSNGTCEVSKEIEVRPTDITEVDVIGLDGDSKINACDSEIELTVMGNAEGTYEWATDNTFTNVIGGGESITVTSAGIYFVKAIVSTGCDSQILEFEVTFDESDVSINFMGEDGTVDLCEGVGAMIVTNPNPEWTYTWSPTDGISGDLYNPLVSPTETTTYSVTVTDGSCEIVEQITVNPTNKTEIEVLDLNIDNKIVSCANQVDVTAMGNAEGTYEWATDSSFTNVIGNGESITVTDAGIYFVKAIVSTGCESEILEFEVTFDESDISIDFMGDDGTVDLCEGVGAMIVTNPNPDWTYTWSPIDGISGDLFNPLISPTETTTYSVTVTDGNCEIVEQITVNPTNKTEIEVLDLDIDDQIKSCASQVDVTVMGNSEGTYQWASDPDFEIVIGTESVITLTESGTYFVRATVSTSCESDVVQFDVVFGEESDVSIEFTDDDGSIEVCEGIGAMIIANPNPEWTYTWSPMDGISGELSNPKVNPAETTIYNVTVSDGACEVTRSIEVVPGDEMTISVSGPDADGNLDICGGSEMVTASGNCEPNYEWSRTADFTDVLSNGETFNITEVGRYYVRAITGDDNCTSNVVEFNAILGDGPSLEFTDDDGSIEVCEGIGAMIIANPNPEWTYTWSPMDGISGELANPKVNPAETTVYSITVSDGLCETIAMIEVVPGNTMEISVSGLDAEGNLDICGGSATLTASGNCEPNYEWSTSPDFTDILSTNELFNVTELGNYYVRAVTGDDNCTSNVIEFEAILGDGPALEFTDDDGSVEVCEGIGAMIIANPNPEWTYTWSPMEGLTGDLSNPKVNPTETTLYSITVTDGLCETTGMIEVVPGDMMQIAVSGVDADGNLDVCGGSKTVTATGNCEPNYEWSRTADFAEVISTQDFYNITEVGQYYVRAVTGDDSCISEVIEINAVLGDGPSLDFTDGGDGIVEVCEGIGGMIISNPNPEWTYTWSPMDGLSGDLSNPKVNPTEPTTYSVTVSDGVCETDGMVQVVPGDSLEIAVQGADSEGRVLVCNGETIVLTATGNCEENYEWSINENFDPIISTSPELTTQVTIGDEYFVRAVVDGCNGEVERITISDISGEFMLPEGTEICPGDTITFAPQAVNNPDSISIVWDEDEHIISDLNSNEITVLSLEGDGDITLSFTKTTADGNCTAQDSIVIPMGMMMDNLEVTTEINCATLLVCFSTSEADGDLSWDFGDESTTEDVSTEGSPCYFYPGPGEYVAVVRGQSSCGIGEMFIPVLISDPVSITSMQDTIDFCEGDELSLSANSEFPQNIYWTSTGSDTLGTGPSIMFSPTSDTTVYAIVTDGETCRDSVDIFLDGYFFEVELMQPDAVCPGEELSIEAINTGTDSLAYLWGPEECIVSGGDTPTPEVVASLTKDIFLTVTNVDNGCTKEFTVPITISDLELELFADPDSIINRGESVDITAAADGDSLVWAWSNGEITESILVQPEETTTYNVQVTDANGCEADGTIIIEVIQPVCDTSDVFIPTGFSPNGDGINDELIVRSNFIKEMQLDIYDRWGEEVFNTADPRTGWNGMFQNTGEELHSDTYAYCLKVTCTNDLSYTMLGNVTLVR